MKRLVLKYKFFSWVNLAKQLKSLVEKLLLVKLRTVNFSLFKTDQSKSVSKLLGQTNFCILFSWLGKINWVSWFLWHQISVSWKQLVKSKVESWFSPHCNLVKFGHLLKSNLVK